ncbi:MAG: hypothetical protein KDK36_11985, partial [Leptospiraceae bacterium]|nr:hypothetical protein [Leptospiraceae bacterium]
MSENNLSQNNTSLDSQNNINFNDLIEKALNSPNSLEIIQTVTNHYPEMRWLTGNTNSTPEAGFDSEGKATYGEQIFPNLDKNLLIEFNRTAVGILILQWVFQNDYESFTNCQNENVKLSRESFEHLKQYIHKILPDYEAVDAMIVYMVINDLTKIKSIIKEIQDKAGIQEIDHDKLLLVALRDHPETSVSYGRLSPKYQKLILNGLSAEFNIGQFVQGENVPASLKGLKSIDKDSLDFFLLHALCDIAGAAGQFIQNGSIVMTEASYLGFHQSISSLEMLNNGAGVEEVYNNYLFLKSKDLGLNIEDLTEKAITRICCMLRYSNFDQAKEVKEVFLKLPINVQSILELELNKNGVNDGFAIIIYYSPALLVNLQKSMKDNFQEGLTIGLTTFARIYQESRISIRKRQGNGVFTVMASTIAKMASENPLEINKHEIYLEEVQNDAEAKLTPFPTIDKTIFPTINSLSEIKGSTILPVGVGGGSDCVQAAQLAELLIEAGKKIPAIVSVRTNTTSSQGTDGKIGEDRTPENAEEISQGVFLINPNTRMKG